MPKSPGHASRVRMPRVRIATRRERRVGVQPNSEGGLMNVSDVMSRDVTIATPNDTVQKVARIMKEQDTGVLPVGENDRLAGMLTARDITVRAAADGKAPSKRRVPDLRSSDAKYVY